jgi:hypothetical protein
MGGTRFWDHRGMSQREWNALPQAEKAFMVSSFEHDILPGVWGDLPESLQRVPLSEVAAILLSLVDRGWIEVHRIAPWTAPDGQVGYQPGDLVPHDQLSAVLADTQEWEYPADPPSWVGALTLVETEAGRKVSHRS